MKKMSKMGKSILLSSLAIIAFGGIAAGTTYALFTSDATTSVSVTTGKVNVSSAIEFSSATTLNGDDVKDITLDNTTNTSKSITFGCGATATIGDNGVVSLSNFVSGDTVTIKVTAKNESTVNVKYRAVVTMDSSLANIFTLTGKVGDNNNNNMLVSDDGIFTQYKVANAVSDANTAEDLDTYYITLGIGTDKDVKDGTQTKGNVTIKIDAIQGNATGKNKTERLEVTNADDLKAALTSDSVDVANKVIEVPKTINLTDTLTVSNTNAEIVLSPSAKIEAPLDKPAFNVTSGTVTLSAATVSGGAGAKGRNRYLASLANDPDTTPIITSAKNAIIAEGKGSKVIIDGVKIVSTGASAIVAKNGGEVVVKSGEVEAQEVAVLVYGGSAATIDNGTFTTKDNFVVGTNGTKDWGENTITINGGVFNGNISSNGYIACGVYVANSDTVNITGGTFNITNGCGVLARSGNTSVSDNVVFNFTNTENGITEGWVGDTKIKLPVNAKIIKDLVAGYPGGIPTVDGKEVIELNQKDGKAYLVSDETSLRNAISDDTNATKYIYLKNDINLTSKLEIITKYTTVYGSGKTQLTVEASDSKNRVFNLDGEDHKDLEKGSFSLVGVNAKTVDTTKEGRGISTYMLKNFKFVIDTASLEAKYPFSLGGYCNGVTVDAKNFTSTGYAAFAVNTFNGHPANNVTANFENCTLTGHNKYDNDDSNRYGTIVVETAATNANLKFTKCKIEAKNSPNYCTEWLLRAKDSSTGSTTFKDCTFFSNDTALNDETSVKNLVNTSTTYSYSIN